MKGRCLLYSGRNDRYIMAKGSGATHFTGYIVPCIKTSLSGVAKWSSQVFFILFPFTLPFSRHMCYNKGKSAETFSQLRSCPIPVGFPAFTLPFYEKGEWL